MAGFLGKAGGSSKSLKLGVKGCQEWSEHRAFLHRRMQQHPAAGRDGW